MNKLKFDIAKIEEIAERIYGFKIVLSGDNWKSTGAVYFDLSEDLIEKIINSEELTEILQKEIVNEIAQQINSEEMEKVREELEKSWNEINGLIFGEIKKFTEEEFEYEEYLCHIFTGLCGHYTPERNIFIPAEKLTTGGKRFVCAEELLHLHYWKVLEKIFNKKNIMQKAFANRDKIGLWHISELIPEYVLVENPVFSKFSWNMASRINDYPWLKELKEELDPLWKNRKSFEDFIIKAHEKLDCVP